MRVLYDYIEERVRQFEKLAGLCGESVAWYRCADKKIAFHFLGAESSVLPTLCAKLFHHLALSASAEGPDYTFLIWDGAGKNDLELFVPDEMRKEGVVRFADGRALLFFERNAGKNFSALMFLPEKHLGLYYTDHFAELPWYERETPFRKFFGWWAAFNGFSFVHAAAVGNANGSVLLAGKGGSGKTTAALSVLGSRLSFVSDDYVLLSAERRFVWSLYGNAKVCPDTLNFLPFLRNCTRPVEGSSKLLVDFEKAGLIIAAGFPIRAIFLPRRSARRESLLCEATSSESLSALAPSTLYQFPNAPSEQARLLNELGILVRGVPSFHLEAGTDIVTVPSVIENFLNQ